MGLKKKDVKIENLGITVPEAYAQICHLNIGLDGSCDARFKIQTSRNAMDLEAFENKFVRLKIDKTLPVHKQVYEYAKENIFQDWEDDIPTEA